MVVRDANGLSRVQFEFMVERTSEEIYLVRPDGSLAYITSYNRTRPAVQAIDIAQKKVLTTISVGSLPRSMVRPSMTTKRGANILGGAPVCDSFATARAIEKSRQTPTSRRGKAQRRTEPI